MQRPQAARTRVKRQDAGGASAGAVSGTAEGYGTAGSSDASEASAEQGEFAPAKKRRRRRKPQGERGAAPDAPAGFFEPPASGDASGR